MNKLRKLATWNNKTEWNEIEGKTATATDVFVRGLGEQEVHFLMDNGVQTWRAPNNLSKLPNKADYERLLSTSNPPTKRS